MQDGTIKLWDAASLSERLSFSVPSGTVLECCFAAADRQVALATSVPRLGPPGHIGPGTGPTLATFVPELRSPLPQLQHDWDRHCARLRRDWAGSVGATGALAGCR